jgi:hypothetical protein
MTFCLDLFNYNNVNTQHSIRSFLTMTHPVALNPYDYIQNYWFFGLLPSSGILENTTFRKLDLFPSSGEGGWRRHLLNWAP